MKRMPGLTPPSASTTARTGTPLQTTQPAAPTVQGVPLGLLGKKPRPLPEHCSTIATVSIPMDLRSRTVSLRGFFTPSSVISQASRSATMAASGVGRLLRRYSCSAGVMTLVPNAPRLVSMVVLLWTMMLAGSFQLTLAGSGLTAAAGACAMAPRVQVAIPAAARALALLARRWRRGKEVGECIRVVSFVVCEVNCELDKAVQGMRNLARRLAKAGLRNSQRLFFLRHQHQRLALS